MDKPFNQDAHVATDQADVVFLVEGTAINGAYINDIKAHYIYPTLEYFTHNTEDEAHSVDKSSVMYGVVVYRTAQAMPGTCCSTFGPFASAQKLINAIDGLILTGGKSESYANMAEGMAVAMQCFEDFAADRNSQRGNSNASPAKAAQKYCIMICNSAPYSMPVPLVGQPFDMKNFEQLAVLFHENNINLSILSPRKIPILFKIFEKAGGDLVHNTKNYSKDPRHLVLLKGYSLKERAISPTATNVISLSSPLQNSSGAIASAGPMDTNSGMAAAEQQQPQQQQQQQQVQPQGNLRPNQQDYQFQMNNQNPIRPNLMGQPGQLQQGQQPGAMGANVQTGPGPMFNNMMNRPMGPNINVARRIPVPGMNPQQQQQQIQGQQSNMGQMGAQQQQQMQQQNQPNILPQNQNMRMPFMNQQQSQMGNKAGMTGNAAGTSDQPQPPQQQQQQQPPPQPTPVAREKIWTGVLEYMDKVSRVTRQISAYATCPVKDGVPEVKAENWPTKLFTQLLPKSSMTAAVTFFAKDSKSLLFHPTSPEGMECFVGNTNNAGCIHFKNCGDIHAAVLLYLPERKQLIGLIPNNQTGFLERLRKTYSDMQQAQAAAQQQQQMQQGLNQGTQGTGNLMEGPSGGGGVDTGGNNNPMMQQQMVNQQQQQMNFQMNPQQQQQQQQQQQPPPPQMGNPQMMMQSLHWHEGQGGQRMVRPVMNANQMQGNINPQQQQMNFQMNPQPQMISEPIQRMVRPQNNQLRHLLQRQPQFNPGMQGVNPQQGGGMQQQQQSFDGFEF